MSRQRHTDRWVNGVRRWLAGTEDADGNRHPLPGMPVPPNQPIRRAVPFVLASMARHDGTCRPTRAYVARALGCSEDTVQRATVELVRLGLLRRVNRAHRGQAQEYQLAIPAWLDRDTARSEAIHRQRERDAPEHPITDGLGRRDTPERDAPERPLHQVEQARAATGGSRGAVDNASDTSDTVTSAADLKQWAAASKRALVDAQFAGLDLADPHVRARHRAALHRHGI